MTDALTPGRHGTPALPSRGAHAAEPDGSGVRWGLTAPRWRRLRGLLTMAVLGGAALAGIQLGVTGPATSPVQPTAAQAAPADAQDTAPLPGPGADGRRGGANRGGGRGR